MCYITRWPGTVLQHEHHVCHVYAYACLTMHRTTRQEWHHSTNELHAHKMNASESIWITWFHWWKCYQVTLLLRSKQLENIVGIHWDSKTNNDRLSISSSMVFLLIAQTTRCYVIHDHHQGSPGQPRNSTKQDYHNQRHNYIKVVEAHANTATYSRWLSPAQYPISEQVLCNRWPACSPLLQYLSRKATTMMDLLCVVSIGGVLIYRIVLITSLLVSRMSLRPSIILLSGLIDLEASSSQWQLLWPDKGSLFSEGAWYHPQ